MSETGFRKTLRTIDNYFVEIAILVICAGILSETGKTKGPVFDAIGPDFFPTATAIIVAALALIQIVMQVFSSRESGLRPDASKPLEINWKRTIYVSIFCVVTIAYVAILSFGAVPLYLATAVFMAITTPLLSFEPNLRRVVTGGAIGLVLGVFLQFVFTQILFVDLPT